MTTAGRKPSALKATAITTGCGTRPVNTWVPNDANAPTWRDHWDDPQILPLLIRVEVVPASGAPWPQLVVEPRIAPEAGCRAWDSNRNRCVGT